jgi:hypothetical protein
VLPTPYKYKILIVAYVKFWKAKKRIKYGLGNKIRIIGPLQIMNFGVSIATQGFGTGEATRHGFIFYANQTVLTPNAQKSGSRHESTPISFKAHSIAAIYSCMLGKK